MSAMASAASNTKRCFFSLLFMSSPDLLHVGTRVYRLFRHSVRAGPSIDVRRIKYAIFNRTVALAILVAQCAAERNGPMVIFCKLVASRGGDRPGIDAGYRPT